MSGAKPDDYEKPKPIFKVRDYLLGAVTLVESSCSYFLTVARRDIEIDKKTGLIVGSGVYVGRAKLEGLPDEPCHNCPPFWPNREARRRAKA